MLEVLKKILRKIGMLKVADLDNDGKVETLNEELQGIFAQFKTMSEKIDETNNQLVEILEDEEQKQIAEKERLERAQREYERKVQESQALQAKVKTNIENNTKVKSKVDEFVVE